MKIKENIFKAYDVRGTYPDELNEDTAYAIGLGTANILEAKNGVVAHDMRLSSPQLAGAVINGLRDGGVDVTNIGLISTDGLYFAVGKYGFESGVMITASHNPPNYNGMKVCEKDAVPLSGDGKLADVKRLIEEDKLNKSSKRGGLVEKNVIQDYVKHALGFVDVSKIKPFKIAVDAGNGMAGMIMPEVFKHLKCTLIPLYFELDGSFPNHPASPIEPENVADLKAKIKETGADLGAAFDGDADRVFLIDEKGQTLGGDMVTALVAKALLKKNPGSTILYNLICSKAVPELINSLGGKAVRTRVGHALIKPLMREYDAIFGGEHSGHFYFRDNWFADSGLIAFLVCLELISEANMPLSEQVALFDHYVRSGEINSHVKDIKAKLREIEAAFKDGKIDKLDGVTVDYGDWWFNVRPSNTEPLVRLNVEANDRELLEKMTNRVLEVIRSNGQ
jgi:phosphomannomutase